jgi:hypothetical protein
MLGRAIISRSTLEARTPVLERARARNTRVESPRSRPGSRAVVSTKTDAAVKKVRAKATTQRRFSQVILFMRWFGRFSSGRRWRRPTKLASTSRSEFSASASAASTCDRGYVR